jgi:hypothetical protein
MGPVGIAPTPMTEGKVFNVYGGRSEWGILSHNRAGRLLGVEPAEELLDC